MEILVMHEEQFEISSLIGGDFYWDVIQDKIVRGEDPQLFKNRIPTLWTLSIKEQRQIYLNDEYKYTCMSPARGM